jgi:hypothetical protein
MAWTLVRISALVLVVAFIPTKSDAAPRDATPQDAVPEYAGPQRQPQSKSQSDAERACNAVCQNSTRVSLTNEEKQLLQRCVANSSCRKLYDPPLDAK